jgi:polyhydroxyalkanoate synthesis repressor PhaR
MAARSPTIIKKYGNRRLYDTGDSRYITLDELSAKIQGGTDVRVIDAKSGKDLTQVTLTQIIVEGRAVAELLPVPLLLQLIRLGDDALAEFFGRWVTGALEMYLQARRGAQAIAPYNPLANLPFAASDALARLWMSSPFGGWGPGQRAPTPPPMPAGIYDAEPPDEHERADDDAADVGHDERADDVAELRRELEELKKAMKAPQAPARPKSRPIKKKG